MYYITNNEGRRIEVTDLDAAIMQADRDRKYRHEDSTYAELDKRLIAYWEDIYDKLTAIKEGTGNGNEKI